MSYHERTHAAKYPRKSAAKPRPAKAAAGWSNKLLDNQQKAKLSIAQRAAYDVHQQAGLVDGMDFNAWKYQQTDIACGLESLREATNKHFRSILAHFLRLAGKEAEAAALWARTGRVAGSDQVNDTHENRDVARAIIRDLITKSNGRLNPPYVAAIAKGKFGEPDLDKLTAKNLQDLVFTLGARLRKLAKDQ